MKCSVLKIFLLFLFFSSTSYAVGFSLQVDQSPEQVRPLLESTFQKIGAPYKENFNTQGFLYRFKAKAPTVFWYSAFVTRYQNGSLIRFDSYNNTSLALADVFAKDHLGKQFPKTYKKKSLTLTYFLTLIEPAFGVIYARIKNPLTSFNPWASAGIALGVDILLFFVGSTTFFTHDIDPFGKGLIATTVLLSAHRLYHIVDLSISLTATNRLIKMGYTFHY